MRNEVHATDGGEVKSLDNNRAVPFPIYKLFLMGSPLGLFLAMRNTKGAALVPNVALCGRMYNVYYSTDPAAYRIEPLVNPKHVDLEPVLIDKWSLDLKVYWINMAVNLLNFI